MSQQKVFLPAGCLWIAIVLVAISRTATGDEHTTLKCLICKRTMDEFRDRVRLLDPHIQVPSGGYVIDSNGVTLQKVISQRKSEQKLSEVLESICKIFEDFARARNKTDGRLTIVRLVNARDQMDFNAAEIDFVPDENQNRGLKYVCEELIDEFSDDIIKTYQSNDDDNIQESVCGEEISRFCVASGDVKDDDGHGTPSEHDEL